MTYALVLVFEDVVEEQYWEVNERLGIGRDGGGDYPTGMLVHLAGPTPTGWVVTEAWDNKASQQSFMAERLGPALAAAGIPAPAQVIDTNAVNYQHLA